MKFGWGLFSLVVLSFQSAFAYNPGTAVPDPHSHANPQEVYVEHLDLDLNVNFDRQILSGEAVLDIKNVSGATTLILDSMDLQILSIRLDNQEATTWSFGRTDDILGSPLSIAVHPTTRKVTIDYATSPSARALLWLKPEQTISKTKPFLLTQSQPHLARSWIPCQDSPQVRVTYKATIHTDPNLGVISLMSAEGNSGSVHANGTYEFEQRHTVPSYLIALGVGNIAFRSLGDRVGVYTDPDLIDRAAYEFANLEKTLLAGEKVAGPYPWGRYDILILPPSFPYGGMENPMLSFITPTLVVGDRSRVSVVTHEMMHSWAGDMVTYANSNFTFLNEGLTMYLENVVTEMVDDDPRVAEMERADDYLGTLGEIKNLGFYHSDTRLVMDFFGKDPETTPSGIVYLKGELFFIHMEEVLGRDRWLSFLRAYFQKFAFDNVTADRFIQTLKSEVIKDDQHLEEELNLAEWLYAPGLPLKHPEPRSAEFNKIDEQVAAFVAGKSASEIETKDWTASHFDHFLSQLTEVKALKNIEDLDKTFHFTESNNAGIFSAWAVLAVKRGYGPALPAIDRFLHSVGRGRYVVPIYTALMKNPSARAKGMEIYASARPLYHSTVQRPLDKLMSAIP